jgi:hypothetical protein
MQKSDEKEDSTARVYNVSHSLLFCRSASTDYTLYRRRTENENRLSQQAVLEGVGHNLCVVLQFHFLHDMCPMRTNRLDTY